MNKTEFFATFKDPNKEEKDIRRLIQIYGRDITLGEVLNDYVRKSEDRDRHKCPKCNGKGYLVEEYNCYPSGLPDSGWVYEPAYDYSVCDLCNGKGYTKEKYKPKIETKIIGYEKIS